jgi:hypothetical protein
MEPLLAGAVPGPHSGCHVLLLSTTLQGPLRIAEAAPPAQSPLWAGNVPLLRNSRTGGLSLAEDTI